MLDQKLTRCPGCATVFRVTAAQLALREGQVRCGHCRAVFDANDHFISLDAGTGRDEFDTQDELARGRPTVTLRSADALQPAPARPVEADPIAVERPTHAAGEDERQSDESFNDPGAGEGVAETATDEGTTGEGTTGEGTTGEGTTGEGTTGEGATGEGAAGEGATGEGTAGERLNGSPPDAVAPLDLAAMDGSERFEWKKRKAPGSRHTPLHVAAVLVLVLGLALQAIFEFRDALAAHVAVSRPLLTWVCQPLGCTIGPLRDAAALSIDASDLQADPAHRGLLLLSATIRNRASHAIAYPYLELTLIDSSDRIVVRRAFAPSDYAGGAAEPLQGIPANGERVVRIFLDASATQQAGYRLYLFYP